MDENAESTVSPDTDTEDTTQDSIPTKKTSQKIGEF